MREEAERSVGADWGHLTGIALAALNGWSDEPEGRGQRMPPKGCYSQGK